jgi:hypothetical protein
MTITIHKNTLDLFYFNEQIEVKIQDNTECSGDTLLSITTTKKIAERLESFESFVIDKAVSDFHDYNAKNRENGRVPDYFVSSYTSFCGYTGNSWGSQDIPVHFYEDWLESKK